MPRLAGALPTAAFLVVSGGATALCGPVFCQDGESSTRAAVPEPPGPPDVVVRGRGYGELRLRIRLAEEAVFARFNDINSTDDFDIHCRMEPMPGSRMRTRVCLSNSWREQDANIAQAVLGRMRGQFGSVPEQFRSEQLIMQRRLADEARRLALEDEALRQAILSLGQAQLALAQRTGTRSDWTAWRQVRAGAEGLPFAAQRMFEVRIGRQRWDHLLTQRTFTIALAAGEIRSLALDCNEGAETFEYESDVEWTTPSNWSSCILSVRARRNTTFALFEF